MTAFSISAADEQLRSETLFGRLGNEEDMAGIILWLCSKGSRHVVGQTGGLELQKGLEMI